MTDFYLYAAMAGVGVFALIIPTVTWVCTRAYYLGAMEDRDARVKRLTRELEAAGHVIEAAEQAGFVAADDPKGRHAR